MRGFVRRVERAVRVYGLTGAVKRGWGAFRSRGHEDAHDDFDEAMGVDTGGIMRLESLTAPAETRRLAHRYQPSDPDTLRRTIAALPIDYEEFAFVDIGSGKGRALLVAAEFPFERIVGVEFAAELHEAAVANLAAYSNPAQRCRQVEALCGDATEYELPDRPLVLYFYNPFLEPVMKRVMANVAASVAKNPRPVFVVLSKDTPHGETVAAAGFALRDDLGTEDRIYEAG